MSEGFDFVGFHIRWQRKRGTTKWYAYTFVAKRPIRSVRDKIRALTPKDVTARSRGRADPDQPDQPRLDQLLQTRRCATHLQPPSGVHLAADRANDAHPAPLEVEGRPPLAHRPQWPVAPDHRGRDRNVQPSCSTDHPVPLPRQQHPQPVGPSCLNQPTADAMESPLRGNTHGGFGERPGETDREQSRHRAPGRLNHSASRLAVSWRLSILAARELRAGSGPRD
jgi:RNA-directed DNA polymerase